MSTRQESDFSANIPGAENPLRFGIIGAGARGAGSFGTMLKKRNGAVLTAFCDPNRLRAERAAARLEVSVNIYHDVRQMIASEKLDAVIITTPDCFHEENALAALESGVHVLIDKPLATTVHGCQNIIDAAEKSGKIVMIGFNLRHHPVLCKLKEVIDSGAAGRIFMIENREFYNGGRGYMARWNRFYSRSGGLWVHKGCHDFDVFQWLLGFPRPLRVGAFAQVSVLTPDNLPFALRDGVRPGPRCHQCPYAEDCPDCVVVRDLKGGPWDDDAVTFDGIAKDECIYLSDKDTHDNGIAIVEYEGGIRASHLECFITPLNDRQYTVIGTRGQIEASLEQRQIVIRPRWGGEVITHQLPPNLGGHGGADPELMKTFIEVLRGAQPNHTLLEHGMLATAVGQAAELSWRERRIVEVEELFR